MNADYAVMEYLLETSTYQHIHFYVWSKTRFQGVKNLGINNPIMPWQPFLLEI